MAQQTPITIKVNNNKLKSKSDLSLAPKNTSGTSTSIASNPDLSREKSLTIDVKQLHKYADGIRTTEVEKDNVIITDHYSVQLRAGWREEGVKTKNQKIRVSGEQVSSDYELNENVMTRDGSILENNPTTNESESQELSEKESQENNLREKLNKIYEEFTKTMRNSSENIENYKLNYDSSLMKELMDILDASDQLTVEDKKLIFSQYPTIIKEIYTQYLNNKNSQLENNNNPEHSLKDILNNFLNEEDESTKLQAFDLLRQTLKKHTVNELLHGLDNINKHNLNKLKEYVLNHKDKLGLNGYATRLFEENYNEKFKDLLNNPKNREKQMAFLQELKANLNRNLTHKELITVNQDYVREENYTKNLEEEIFRRNKLGNNVIIIDFDNIPGPVVLNNLKIPQGANVIFTSKDKIDINIKNSQINGNITFQGGVNGHISGEAKLDEKSKKTNISSGANGTTTGATSLRGTDVTDTKVKGIIVDWAIKLLNDPIGLKKLSGHRRRVVMNLFKDMIYNENTIFSPSEKETIKAFLESKEFNELEPSQKEALTGKNIKIINKILSTTNQKPEGIKDFLQGLNDEAVKILCESVSAQMENISENDIKEIIGKIKNNTLPEKTIKTFKDFEEKYEKIVNDQIHKLLEGYSHSVNIDPNMTIEELRKYLENENTYAEIVGRENYDITLLVDDEQVHLENPLHVKDYSTGRIFIVGEYKGRVAVVLEDCGKFEDEKDIIKKKIFWFDSPSKFLSNYIINDKKLLSTNDDKKRNEESEENNPKNKIVQEGATPKNE